MSSAGVTRFSVDIKLKDKANDRLQVANSLGVRLERGGRTDATYGTNVVY